MEWKSAFLSLLQWIETQGPEAALWIIALQALMVLLIIPGPFFTAAAGFLFGIWWGLLIAVTGSTLGAAAAYGIARILPRSRRFESLRERPGIQLLEQFIREGGWKVVLSTRLIPFFPFKISNYFFGWVRFSFRDFLIGTFIGIIPMTAVSVAAGSLASDMAALLQPGGPPMGNRWMLSLGGLVLAVGVFAYAGYQGRKKFKQMQAEGKVRGPAREEVKR
jgi:uncharacterized membrane protein YdjX (TVP38/TMEM64 family)